METTLSITFYTTTSQLPDNWNNFSVSNIFLSKEYFKVLEQSSPKNMRCFFIGFFENEKLIGTGLSQYLNLNHLESFGERDSSIKTSVRNFVFKKFCSQVLFFGNNMLTGQNAYYFDENIDDKTIAQGLIKASEELKQLLENEGLKVHMTTFKDFTDSETSSLQQAGFENYYRFITQPNMVFDIPDNWDSEQNYIDALSKKYRDQYKRARKKAATLTKRKLSLEDIIRNEKIIYKLYLNVAQNAPFNTFFLSLNHFRLLKENLKDKFLLYGYFSENELIGFSTMIVNGNVMDTYFLGYDENIQREKMLYLNMLYDMIAFSVNKKFTKIIFARTALEIKSSVGAKPLNMYGFIKHSSPMIDSSLSKLFKYFEPKTNWKERNPFK